MELEPPTILFLGYFNNVSRKDVGIVVTEAGQHVHLKTFVNIYLIGTVYWALLSLTWPYVALLSLSKPY